MALHKRANKTIWPFFSIRGLKCPIIVYYTFIYTCKVGPQCLGYSYFVKKLDLAFKMCLPMSTTGPSKDLGDVLNAQIVIKIWPDCSPMSQELKETLISKIWWRMPEIFDQKHVWIGVFLVKSLNNHICLPFMQHHLLDYFWISQRVRWSIVTWKLNQPFGHLPVVCFNLE